MTNKNEVAGKIRQMKGAAKEKAGEWTENPDLEAEGLADRAAGTAQEGVGTVQRKAEEAAQKVKKTLNP
jgi:uncharacterized protein YjbJ (UPF0337 family)